MAADIPTVQEYVQRLKRFGQACDAVREEAKWLVNTASELHISLPGLLEDAYLHVRIDLNRVARETEKLVG